MITTNIDGTTPNASNQLFDLLALVSNPDVYTAKLKALQDATDANNKTIALVGPANQVLELRDTAAAAVDAATQKLANAQTAADQIKQVAQDEASGLLTSARQQAQQLVADANTLKADAGAALSIAQSNAKSAAVAEAKAKEADAASQAAAVSLRNAIDAANKAKADADATKAEIIAKHKAFIESL
jgi:hypothetical protein